MRYPYHVKANGRYYAPNEEIVEDNAQQEKTANDRPPDKSTGRRGKKTN